MKNVCCDKVEQRSSHGDTEVGWLLSRSTGCVTYSLALGSASRDDACTCGSPRGQLMSRQRDVRT